MNGDEVYRLARAGEQGTLTDEDVRAFVAAYAGEEAVRWFPMRYQPQGALSDPDKVLWRPVPALEPAGAFIAVGFMFGEDDPDEMLAWKPRWHACRGPMTREELEAL